MTAGKEVEYKEALAGVRHQLDYRLKLFALAIAFNGALLATVLEHLSDTTAKLLGCFMGLATTVALMLAERRSVDVARRYADYGMKLEEDSDLGLLTEVIGGLRRSRGRYRYYFFALYLLIVLLWIGCAIYVAWP